MNDDQVVGNSFHLSYLLNTIDCDSKQTRKAIKSRKLPIYCDAAAIDPPSASEFKSAMEKMYNHYPNEFHGGHQDKKYHIEDVTKAKHSEFFELFRGKGYLYLSLISSLCPYFLYVTLQTFTLRQVRPSSERHTARPSAASRDPSASVP